MLFEQNQVIALWISISDNNFVKLCPSLLKNTSVRALHLREKLTDQGVQTLCEMFKNKGSSNRIKALALNSNNSITNKGAKMIYDLLGHVYLPQICMVDLDVGEFKNIHPRLILWINYRSYLQSKMKWVYLLLHSNNFLKEIARRIVQVSCKSWSKDVKLPKFKKASEGEDYEQYEEDFDLSIDEFFILRDDDMDEEDKSVLQEGLFWNQVMDEDRSSGD